MSQSLLEEGYALYADGDYRAAAERAGVVLRQDARDLDALTLLGLAAQRLGHPKDALRCFDLAVEVDGRRASTFTNRARVHVALDEQQDALNDLHRAVRLDPEQKQARLLLAQLLLDERPDEALRHARLAGAGETARGLVAESARRAAQGRDPAARVALLRLGLDALSHPALYNDLGNALREAGSPEAEAAWQQAIALGEPLAHANLAVWRLERGDPDGALEQAALAIRAGVDAWLVYADALSAAEPAHLDLLPGALQRPDLDHQRLERACRATMQQDPAIAAGLVTPGVAAFEALRAHPVLHPWLRRTLVRGAEWWRLLVALRDWLVEVDDREARLSVAQQAFWTDYAWPGEPPEGPPLVRAMFTWVDGLPEPLASRQVELAREAAIDVPVRALGNDATSAAVREMYEQAPYPRLVGHHRKPAAPLGAVVRSLFPHFEGQVGHRVLIAGCGTGQQALAAALRYQDADILAVDLSEASLRVAMRLAEDHGAALRFARADLLALGDLPERFDLIECGGVLHHLADPMAGWRVLRGLLAPSGLMKIALYSEAARTEIVAARALIAEHGWPPTPEGIRAARAHLLALPDDHPARPVVLSPDFASLRGTRDLIFHVCEHRFTVPQLAQALEALDLEFLGFQHPVPQVARWYAERFPEDPTQQDLQRWHLFEGEHPRAFAGMYQFWARAR